MRTFDITTARDLAKDTDPDLAKLTRNAQLVIAQDKLHKRLKRDARIALGVLRRVKIEADQTELPENSLI